MTFLKKDNLIVLGKFSYYFFNKKIIAFTYRKMEGKSYTRSCLFLTLSNAYLGQKNSFLSLKISSKITQYLSEGEVFLLFLSF